MTEIDNAEAVAWILRADNGNVQLWTQDRGFAEQKAGDWEADSEPLFPLSSISSRNARIADLVAVAPMAGEVTDADGIAWFERTFGVPLGDVPGRLDVERVRAALSSKGEGE